MRTGADQLQPGQERHNRLQFVRRNFSSEQAAHDNPGHAAFQQLQHCGRLWIHN